MSYGLNNQKSDKRVLIVISSDLFVRNLIKTSALNEIEKKYNCSIIASEEVINKQPLIEKTNFCGFYKYSKSIEKWHFRFFNILMWRNRKKSSTFKYRILRNIKIEKLIWRGKTNQYFLSLLQFVAFNLFRNYGFWQGLLLGNRLVYPIVSLLYERIMPINREISDYIQKIDPDIIIFPSSAYDAEGTDVIRVARTKNIKSIFLIDNWDNLSSKTIFYYSPDFLTVWGEQSLEHAQSIHGFDRACTFIIGTPRFDHYYNLVDTDLKSYFDFPYVLFVGCSIPFDETSALKILEDEIENNPAIYHNLKVVYRPHPWRNPRDKEVVFNPDYFKHIVLDPQVADAYLTNQGRCNHNIGFQPETEYYPSLLKNAKFIIGPLTSMLIEGIIFKKAVLALAYDDNIHFTSPDKAYKYYMHFRGLEKLKNMVFCFKANELRCLFQLFLKTSNYGRLNVDSDILKYFIYNDNIDYNLRLLNVIDYILGK